MLGHVTHFTLVNTLPDMQSPSQQNAAAERASLPRPGDVDGRNADDELQTVDIFSRRPFIKFI